MDFALTETQRQLKAAARRYLADRYPPSRIAELSDAGGPAGGEFHGNGNDGAAWSELQRQGWLDPDLGMVELALLAEEGGRALHPAPWWATVGLALPVYQAAAVELPGPATLADGTATCGAHREGDTWRLGGRVTGVVDARSATEIVVAAMTGTGVALFGVRPDGPGVALAARAGIDPLRGFADLELTRASARLLVGPPAADSVLASVERRASALLACEAVGVADRALELAVEYARSRVQFDRPIGSYQAVAHRLADSYANLELARSLAYRSACVLAAPAAQAQDVTEALACSSYACALAATEVCETAIQTAGGIGVTWEFPLHRWYRRALWLQTFHAARPDPLATIAGLLLDSGATRAVVTARRDR